MSNKEKESPFVGKVCLSGVPGQERSAVAHVKMEGLEESWGQMSEGIIFFEKYKGVEGAQGGIYVVRNGAKVVGPVQLECRDCPVNYFGTRNFINETWGCNALRENGEAIVAGKESLTPEEWRKKMQEEGARCGAYLKLEGEVTTVPVATQEPKAKRKLFGIFN